MTTEAKKSTAITNLDATPAVPSATGEGAVGMLREVGGTVVVSASMAAGSTYQLARIPTNAKVKEVRFESAAQGAGKFDIGLYYSSAADGTPPANAGTVVSGQSQLFASDVDCASAVAITNVTNESGNYTAEKRLQPIWQAAGLTSDPGGFFDVVAAVHTTDVTTGTGRIGLSVQFVM